MRINPLIIRLSELRKEARDTKANYNELPPLPQAYCPADDEDDDNPEQDLFSIIIGDSK